MRVDDAIEQLRQQQASIRCSDLVQILTGLGFEVRSGRAPGHKVVTHPKIKGLYSNFDCGHGRSPEVRVPYVLNMRRVLRQYHSELTELETKAIASAKKEETP